MTPRATNGPAAVSVESTTNKIMKMTLDFDGSVSEAAQIRFPMPKRWDEGTITAEFLWSSPNSAQNVVWGCRAIAFGDNDEIDRSDISWGTGQTVADTAVTSNALCRTAKTAGITIGNSPAEGDLVVFEFYRDPANASDTSSSDARLYAVILTLTANAGDDS